MHRCVDLLALLPLTACGRLSFDQEPARDAAPRTVDASADAAADGGPSSLIHQYSLQNSLSDDLGGPDLVSLGGTLTMNGYMFAANEGLSLTNAVPPSVYTVDILFSFDITANYNKLLDFKGRTSDAGLYVYNTQLQFVVIPITGCPGNDCYTSVPSLFADFATVQVTLTRDATGLVTGYVARQQVFSFDDSMAVGAFDMAGAVANFFIDDTSTNTEASPGTANRIRIYSTALSASEIQP